MKCVLIIFLLIFVLLVVVLLLVLMLGGVLFICVGLCGFGDLYGWLVVVIVSLVDVFVGCDDVVLCDMFMWLG